ncbi:MFS transporter [Paenibacillus sp. GCM10027626]|uniref:MFS transporter n=1 Tax=Paenibacillus sp. GCM10027626 TaxID=3273411 RepID=UPI00362568FD
MTRLVFLGCAAYLAVGLGQLVMGTVMEPMVHAYGVQYGDGGQLVMHQFLGGMVGIMCSPWLIRKFGKKAVLLTALGVMALIQFSYMSLPSWGVMLALAPFAGFGFGTTESVVGSFIIGATGDKANVSMSRVEVFFGVGALLMPFAGAALINAGYWRFAFGIVGLIAVCTLLLWLVLWPALLNKPFDQASSLEHGHTTASPIAGRSLVPLLAAGILFFSFYVGLEMSYVHYLPSLLVASNGLAESTATLALSLFWGAMSIGRLISGQLADRFGGGTYLIFVCAVNALLFIMMGWLTDTVSMFMFAFGTGLFMSGMFAIALVFTNRAAPGRVERTTSLLMAAGGIGGALFPKATGWFMDDFGMDATRWLFAGCAVALLIIMTASAFFARRLQSQQSGVH